MRLSKCNNIEDLRRGAERRLPLPMFHYIDGGSDDEVTLRRNTEGFADYGLVADCLKPVDKIDLSTNVLGADLKLPFFLSPTGMSKLFHHTAEPAVARAAEKFGTLYSLSTVATTSLEDIADLTSGPKMFQIYILKDRSLTTEFVERCKTARYQALCLTVDMPLAGNRERDKVTGMTMPPRFSMKSMLSFLTHPSWGLGVLRSPKFNLENVAHRVDVLSQSTISLIDYVNSQFDRTINWDDVAWLIEQWDGPFVIKGIQSVSDAIRAADAGASAIMVSNHGGRQLDSGLGSIDLLPAIAEAVGGRVEIILDGGIRRGTHILKALALGANACSIGKAYLYGLAAAGQQGVEKALSILQEEFERDMALLGVNKIDDISPDHIMRLHR